MVPSISSASKNNKKSKNSKKTQKPAEPVSLMPKPINWADPVIMQERIVGGNEAAPHSWPWTVHIVTGFYSDF